MVELESAVEAYLYYIRAMPMFVVDSRKQRDNNNVANCPFFQPFFF
jgi:hypothetical protein